MFPRLALGLAFAAVALPASAQDRVLTVSFQERETDDSFYIRNVAPCLGVVILEVSIDLSTALGPVFFDAGPGDVGYEDEQYDRFTPIEGATYVRGISRLEDGGDVITVQLEDFESGAEMRFGIDVDDRKGPVEGTLDDASARDMERTSVAAKMINPAGDVRAERTTFGQDGVATLTWPDVCETDASANEG